METIRVIFVDKTSDNPMEHELVCQETFENCLDHFDQRVSKYVYDNVTELNRKYNFIDWENAPSIEIIIYATVDKKRKKCSQTKILEIDDCVKYMYEL